MNPYTKATFLKSAASVKDLPTDIGYEVAFAGRSNAGKSSALNFLTGQRNLARTSKTPGRTQLINLFNLDENRRLVDLPGYGYAKVAQKTKSDWQKHLAHYLEIRHCLRGLVLLMDCRHPLKELDQSMINWALESDLPIHILLTKSDKLSRSEINKNIHLVQKAYDLIPEQVSVQSFSCLKKEGLHTLILKLNDWFEFSGEAVRHEGS